MILYPPNPAMSHLITHFGVGYARVGEETAEFEYYPDGHADLLVQVDEDACRLLLFGPARQRAAIRMRSAQRHFLVRFRPGRFPRHGEVDPSALVDGYACLDTLFGRSRARWGELLRAAATPAACQRVLVDPLLNTAAHSPVPPTAGRALVDWIVRTRGMASIGNFVRAHRISLRQLQRHTREMVGLAPKTLARHVRLQWVLRSLHLGQTDPLTDLAFEAGYFDQPHFIRDFKSLTGKTPGDLLTDRRLIPWMILRAPKEREKVAIAIRHQI
ncbi:MAG: helix-turn-helix domain-containing protein [Desulfosarcinaceae bacterium]|jgi:AraC-like DNA-binding protein